MKTGRFRVTNPHNNVEGDYYDEGDAAVAAADALALKGVYCEVVREVNGRWHTLIEFHPQEDGSIKAYLPSLDIWTHKPKKVIH